jgi:hypothetical protein
MIRRLLAWLSMGLTLSFVATSIVGLFFGGSLGSAMPLVMWIGFGLLGLAVVLTVTILVMAAIG